MTTTYRRRARSTGETLSRVVGVFLATAVIASIVAGIPVVPGIGRPAAAHAEEVVGRLCHNSRASASSFAAGAEAKFDLYVPNGVAVTVAGSIDILERSGWPGGYETIFHVDPIGWNNFGSYHAGPQSNLGFSWTWTNNGPSGVIPVTVRQELGTLINWRFTVTLSNGGGEAACAPLSAGVTLGHNCAAKAVSKAQVEMADPVNTATGNFHQPFDDFAVPGRGPGLALSHSYNSLRAGADGPLGFGWTHSYAMKLVPNLPVGGATLVQEGGAEVPFYSNGAGGYEAPVYAVATLVKNPDGSYTVRRCNSTIFGFSPTGELTSITDLNGYSTTLAYASGKLATVTDSAGRKLTFGWTGARITSVADPSSPARTVTFGYDGAGNLTDYTDAGGARWRFTYDAGHRLETMRRPRHAEVASPPVTRNVYDSTNRVVSQTDELNRTTTFDYTTIPGSTKVSDPKGNVTVLAYTDLLPTALTRGWGTAQAATWRFETNRMGSVTKVTDPNDHVVVNTYDNHGNLLSSTDALNRRVTATYNQFDLPLTVTDPDQVTTTYTYDGAGNLKTVSTPLRGTTQVRQTVLSYDPARPGDVISVTDPKGKVWSQAYDAYGNLTSDTDPLGNRTLYGYDVAKGQMTSAVSPRGTAAGVVPGCTPPALGCARFAYDAWGHVGVATDANNHASTRHYDVEGNVDYDIDAQGNRTEYFYDAAGQAVTTKRADGTELRTTYWPDGSVKETLDGAQAATRYDYDAQGRVSSATDPNNRKTVYGYDPAGNLRTKADAGGSCPGAACTSYAYDVADQLKSISYGDGTTPNVTNIGYDPLGRRTAMTDGSGTSTWAWDSLGRSTAAKDGANKTVSYGYANLRDPATTITYPSNKTVVRDFDSAGRMTTTTDWLSNTTTYTPDADSNITKVTPPAGTGLVDSYAFDDADRLMGITAKAGAATTASYSYGRDRNGQESSVTTTGLSDTHSYGYTVLNELEKVDGAVAYGYDDADNLSAAPGGAVAAYDPANQLKTLARASNLTTYAFDSRGNRTEAKPRVGTAMTYSYDQANRMVAAEPTTYNDDSSVGWYHTVASRSDGTVWNWGYNSNGQLGNNSTTTSPVPVPVSGLTGVVAVAGAAYQSIALKADGTVWAWGWNGVGQLGNNSTADSWVPVQVHGLSGVVAIAAGASHLLALKGDGTVWAWGYNSNGQLGNNSTTDSPVAVQVQGLGNVTAIAGGYTSSYALKADGTVWGWGYNAYGQLGNNTTTDATVPVQVQNLSGVAAIASGYFHGLAVKGDGTVWAWGWNGGGQLGNNTNVDAHLPVQAQGLTGVASVAADSYQSMALRSDGSVAAWGWNAYGQLADGSTTDSWVPKNVSSLAGSKAIAAGPNNGLALRADGSAVGWGWNGTGAVGDGTTTDRLSPVAVSGYNRGSAPLAQYAYDGGGLRTKKTVAGVTTNFTWESSSGLPLLIDDGTNYYIYGPDGLPLEHIDRSGNVTWYHHDQLGSTRTLSSNTGATVATATYDPYGRLVSSTGKLSPLGFAGEYTDAETGFVYLRARYYDPATAQFLTRDPLVALTGSAYGYVGGNPLNETDPSGLCWGPGCWLESAAKSTHGQIVKQVANTGAALTGIAATGAFVLALTPCSAFCGAVALGLETTSRTLDTVAAVIECTDGGGLDSKCAANIAGALLPVVSGLVLGQLNVDPLVHLIAGYLDNAKDALGFWFDRQDSRDC